MRERKHFIKPLPNPEPEMELKTALKVDFERETVNIIVYNCRI